MHTSEILNGTVHKIPPDLRKALASHDKSITAWNNITPLARNEWICWVESAKLADTRERRVKRVHKELAEGKRRPCCWIGCIHREDKPISSSVRWVLDKNKKSPKK